MNEEKRKALSARWLFAACRGVPALGPRERGADAAGLSVEERK